MVYLICEKCGEELEIFDIINGKICEECYIELKSLTFWERYDLWKKSAYNEFVESEFYNEESIEDIEICEDGSIYYNDLLNYAKDVATPWVYSMYYID